MANSNKKQKRISDIIKKEDIDDWRPGDNILIKAPMGSGKSYFCKNDLYEYAKKEKSKILMLTHRVNCTDQFKNEMYEDGKVGVIDITTYQSLEYAKLHDTGKYDLSGYRFIVCDEFHYFFDDSRFNNYTWISFKMIMEDTNAIHIFMSATGDSISRYIERYIDEHRLKKAIHYDIPSDFSFIGQLTFFWKDETMEGFLSDSIAKGNRAIFFIESAKKGYKLYSKYKEHCIFNCAVSNEYHKYVDEEKINDILIHQRFAEQFLITTTCFDSGINIVDDDIKYIFVDVVDIWSLIQCIGRRRIQGPDDKITVYVKVINNQRIAGLQQSAKNKIRMADHFIENGIDGLLKRFYMKNDINNILYDEAVYDKDGKLITGTYNKGLNHMMYFKNQELIDEYQSILGCGKRGYCKYLGDLLGFYDKKTGRHRYMMMDEDHGLNDRLKSIADDDTVYLQQKDRNELIRLIGAKQNGRLLKKANTLNQILEEREIDYRIKVFATTRYINDGQGNVKKKIYRNAWKLVHF